MNRFTKRLKKAFLWLWMLEKRVLKKPAVIAIMLLMPLLALGLSSAVGNTRGILTVAVWWDPADEEAEAFADEIMAQNGVIHAYHAESEEAAREAVDNNSINFAWIIPSGFDEHLRHYVKGEEDSLMVIVVEKEESALTSLARERLFTFLFPRVSYALFRERVQALQPDTVLSEKDVQTLYRKSHTEGLSVRFVDANGKEVQSGKVLTAPARGMLSLLVVEGGIAAAILCSEDEKRGVYLMLPRSRRVPLRLASVFVPMVNLAVMAYLALWMGGLLTDPLYEAGLMFLFLLAAYGFSLMLLAILRAPGRLGLAALFTAILTLALTPIFLDLSGATPLSALLPGFHYLRGVYSYDSMRWLLVYACISVLTAAGVESVVLRNQK